MDNCRRSHYDHDEGTTSKETKELNKEMMLFPFLYNQKRRFTVSLIELISLEELPLSQPKLKKVAAKNLKKAMLKKM